MGHDLTTHFEKKSLCRPLERWMARWLNSGQPMKPLEPQNAFKDDLTLESENCYCLKYNHFPINNAFNMQHGVFIFGKALLCV